MLSNYFFLFPSSDFSVLNATGEDYIAVEGVEVLLTAPLIPRDLRCLK